MLGKVINFIKSYTIEVRWEWHKGGFYLFKRLPQHLKLTARIGIFIISINVLLTLIAFFYGEKFHLVTIESEELIFQLPRISIWLSTFSYALGWGLILTGAVFTNIWRPFLFSILLASGMYAVRFLSASLHPVWVIAASLASGVLLFFIIGILWKPVRADLFEIIEMRKSIFRTD